MPFWAAGETVGITRLRMALGGEIRGMQIKKQQPVEGLLIQIWCRKPESNRHGVATGRF